MLLNCRGTQRDFIMIISTVSTSFSSLGTTAWSEHVRDLTAVTCDPALDRLLANVSTKCLVTFLTGSHFISVMDSLPNFRFKDCVFVFNEERTESVSLEPCVGLSIKGSKIAL